MSDDVLESALRMIRGRNVGLPGIYLFGSRASAQARPDSDWDFAVLGGPFDKILLLETAAEAATLLCAEVDLVDLSTASTALQFQVIQTGRLLGPFDQRSVDRFEMETLTAYQNLNESRKAILRDFGMAA
jgi:predicted nucleotidyltransferase